MKNFRSRFLRKRWYDFRMGHSIYLIFIMSFANFILIGYNFAIKKSPVLSEIFENTLLFAVAFVFVYIPLAMIIGYYHRRKQLVVEYEAGQQENWLLAWFIYHIIRQSEGKTTPEENARILKFLEDIMKRHKKNYLLPKKTQEESEKSDD